MSKADFDAIIFDCDGVLVDSEAIHISVGREFLAELGLDYDLHTYKDRFTGQSVADSHKAFSDDYYDAYGKPFPSDFSDRLHLRTWPRMEADLEPLPGISALIDMFDGPVAVASSAPIPTLHRKLKIAALNRYFEPHIYSADHVPNGKPAPDLFLYTARKLRVQASRCLVIEDSVHGIRAAQAANMKSLGFIGGSHADEALQDKLLRAGAVAAVRSHKEVVEFLVG